MQMFAPVSRGLSIALAALTLVGCAGATEGEGDESLDIVAEGLTGPTVFFQSYTYAQSNGGGQVERFADCGPDQVLTGVGARVIDSNFTDLTIYCRDIGANGQLSVSESQFTVGGPSEEQSLHAGNGLVFVGVGAIVSGDNVARIVARVCPWIAASKRLDVANCSYSSTLPGSNSTEASLDMHNGVSAANKPRTVATGAGFTASGGNVFAVRMSSGLLK
jgi:hypothetical protein